MCWGNCQDRKVVIKSLKSFILKIAKEEFGHMVLLAAFDVVDDTKFVQKVILDVRSNDLLLCRYNLDLITI